MTVDLASFPFLWTQWTAAKKERRRRIRETQHEVVERWKANLVALERAQSDLIDQGKWVSGPSSLMAVLGIGHREIYHCRVLAWLMDPTGRHGLGDAVLHGVLGACFPERTFMESDLRQAKTSIEDSSDGLRTDIVARTGRLTLIIEAKTVSEEGQRQCDATYDAFVKKEKNAHFVFLSPSGRDPYTAHGAAKEAFRALSWQDVACVVEEALNRLRDGKKDDVAVETVRNHLATLQREFV